MSDESRILEFVALGEVFMDTAPEPGAKHLPAWIKEIPGVLQDEAHATIKKCPAIFDAVSMGYVVRSPCDIQVVGDMEKRELHFRAARGRTEEFVSVHNAKLFSDKFPFVNDYWPASLKIDTKFLLQAPDGYSIAFVPLYYTPQYQHYHALYGVADTFSMGEPRPVMVNLFVRKLAASFIIHRGDPLCLLVPFKAESFSHTVRTATDEDRDRLDVFEERMSLGFQHNALKTARHRKQFA